MNLPLNMSTNTSDPIAQARFNMIEQQIRPWDVHDPVVLEHAGPSCKPRRFCTRSRLAQRWPLLDMEVPLLGN
jgi:protein-L-isoaspartate(D-aspartate) O-methyltransferase